MTCPFLVLWYAASHRYSYRVGIYLYPIVGYICVFQAGGGLQAVRHLPKNIRYEVKENSSEEEIEICSSQTRGVSTKFEVWQDRQSNSDRLAWEWSLLVEFHMIHDIIYPYIYIAHWKPHWYLKQSLGATAQSSTPSRWPTQGCWEEGCLQVGEWKTNMFRKHSSRWVFWFWFYSAENQ